MPLTRQQKEQRVAEVQEALSNAISIVFVSFDAFGVEDSEELREKMFEKGVSMRVVPKRLLKIALQNAKLDFESVKAEGQMAVVWGSDAVAPAKTMYDFARGKENIVLTGGAMEGAMLSHDEVMALAQLPSYEQLLGQFVSVLAGPARGLVTVLSGAQRDLVYALSAIADQKQTA